MDFYKKSEMLFHYIYEIKVEQSSYYSRNSVFKFFVKIMFYGVKI